jgi:hypothetical protein
MMVGKQPTWCCRETQARPRKILADTPIDTIKEQFATKNIAAKVDSKCRRKPSEDEPRQVTMIYSSRHVNVLEWCGVHMCTHRGFSFQWLHM